MNIRCLGMLLFFVSPFVHAQTRYTISGNVQDKKSGEALPGVVITVSELPATAVTNTYGFYSLTLPAGSYRLSFHYTGYVRTDTFISLNSHIRLNLAVQEQVHALNEAIVNARVKGRSAGRPQGGMEHINMKEIENIPVFMGERDLLKTLQLLPGIKTVSEGNTGLFVRGGSPDQNLVLLDEATIYNPSHILGFFSVFNSDAIKEATVYKGGMPAEYGGRISSVMDIKMNEGNSKTFRVTGGAGLIISRLTVEGPLFKNKGSFMVSGRRFYGDVLARAYGPNDVKHAEMNFYDLNMKINYQLNQNNRIYLSSFTGSDHFKFDNRTNRNVETNWGNVSGTLRWNHIFGRRLFLNSSLVAVNYRSDVITSAGDAQFKITTGIRDYGIKEDFQCYLSAKHTLKFGLQSTYHTFIPGDVSRVAGEEQLQNQSVARKYALESGIYFSDNYVVSSRLIIQYGSRLSLFSCMGPGTVTIYDVNANVSSSQYYSAAHVYNTYGGIEPRIAIEYHVKKNGTIKAFAQHAMQYLHLLSNSTAATPVDLWIPAGKTVKPQQGQQLSAGYYHSFVNQVFEASVEMYYKFLQNQVDYKPGALLVLNQAIESQLIFGSGRAYGTELMFRKRYGKLTGWASYTLSRSLRNFASVNDGNTFPARQDMIHAVSFVMAWQFHKRLTASVAWIYNTGPAVTFPSGKYAVGGVYYNYYGYRNMSRMPAYHRMDVGVTWKGRPHARFESSWNFSVYNVYARQNAYSITFMQNTRPPYEMQAIQLSLFRLIPSVTYNFKF